MKEICRSLAWTALCGLLFACAPRTVIPAPTSGVGTTVSVCDKLANCGQCVSNARCGWCAGTNSCIVAESAQTCSTGWIPKDPEQQLCQADKPASQAQH